MRQFKIIVEKHPDGCVAYPLGLKGVVVGQGDIGELSRVVQDIVEADDKSTRLACRHRAEQHFRSSDRYRDYCRLFEDVVGQAATKLNSANA